MFGSSLLLVALAALQDPQASQPAPPVTHQPVTVQPVPDQPVPDQPVTDQPVTDQPVTVQPITDQPVTHQPVTDQPVTLDPLTTIGRRGPAPVRTSTAGSKTSTPLKDVPAAIVVVPAEVLDAQNAQTMDQAVRNASGLAPVMGGSYGFADRYLLRGMSQRFLRDGLPDGPSFNGYARTMTDVAAIEVLKGPGSALYGRTEPGGVVNVVTKRPLLRSDWAAEVGAGSFGSSHLALGGGAPVGPVATRIDAGYQHTDGFRGVGRTIWEAMPSAELRLADQHTLILDYDLRRIEIVPDNYGILYAPIDPAAPVRNERPIAVDPETRYYSPFNQVRQLMHRLTLRHEWRPNAAVEVRSAVAFDRRQLYLMRNAGGAAAGAGDALRSTGRQGREQRDRAYYLVLQNEVVARGRTGPLAHTALLGLEAEKFQIRSRREDMALPNIDDVRAPVVPEARANDFTRLLSFDRRVRSDSVGVYAQEQIDLGVLKLRAGGRFDQVAFSDSGISKFPVASAPVTSRNIAASQQLLTGQVGAVVQPIPAFSVYGGVASGKFLNLQTESPHVTTVPEGSSQIEAGLKTALLDDRLQANAAVFRTKRDNFYVTPFGGTDPEPVGEQRTDGVELDVLVLAARGLTLTANYAIYRARITSDQLQTLGSTQLNIRGKVPQGVPNQIANLWATYELFGPGALSGFGLGGGLRYQGESFADALNLNRVPDFLLVDATAFYRRRHYEVQVNVTNLTDAEHFTHATFSGAAPGLPRAVHGTVRYRY